jgi:perosamine synthetase
MIPVNRPLFDGNEKRYVDECIETGWVSSEGPFVSRFEREFASTTDRRHGIAVSSGSAALDIVIAALGIGPGDEVLMPSFTIISCAQAVVRSGARPVLLDCDPQSWNLMADQVEEKITSRTRAIMAVHIYGLTTDMTRVCDLARHYGLAVIEDAAQAIGQSCSGKPCGSFGDISVFSFYANKHISTGEGGMVLTNDDALAKSCRGFRNLCFDEGRRFLHHQLGWNYRMTNLQAALGCAQLERLAPHLARKQQTGRLYTELLSDLPLQLPLPDCPWTKNLYWVYGLVLPEECNMDATSAISRLAAKGVGARPFFWPMHQQPVFKEMGLFQDQTLPVSERLARQGLYLPSGLGITDEEIYEVAEAVREIME